MLKSVQKCKQLYKPLKYVYNYFTQYFRHFYSDKIVCTVLYYAAGFYILYSRNPLFYHVLLTAPPPYITGSGSSIGRSLGGWGGQGAFIVEFVGDVKLIGNLGDENIFYFLLRAVSEGERGGGWYVMG
jgi:hypothetical protein